MRFARNRAARSTATDNAQSPRDRFGIPIAAVYDSNLGGAVRSTYIPNNDLSAYISPGSPFLPSNLEPTPGVAGNLIDPVAQNMLKLFPEPNVPQEGPSTLTGLAQAPVRATPTSSTSRLTTVSTSRT